jgi:hypothetical protein
MQVANLTSVNLERQYPALVQIIWLYSNLCQASIALPPPMRMV